MTHFAKICPKVIHQDILVISKKEFLNLLYDSDPW